MGYLKRATKKMQRSFNRMKWYIQFLKKDDLYQEVDEKKIKRLSNETLEEEQKKLKRKLKLIENFETWKMTIIVVIIAIIIAIVISQPKIYWWAKYLTVVAFLVYAIECIVLIMRAAKAKQFLEKNINTINIEKARRAIHKRDYSKVKAIDSPELCAILAKAIEPIIDEAGIDGKFFYNIYIHGRCYKMELDAKLEEVVKITD